MHSIQQLRWKDVLDDVLYPSDLTFDWVKLNFLQGFQSNDRDGLYVTGPYGVAEITPLPGYFDREIDCLLAGIDTVSNQWPKPKHDHVQTNILVSNDYDLDIQKLSQASCIKVKVHTIRDCERVKKVRDLSGRDVKIRIDCNGRFSVEEALEILYNLRDIGLELIEQPCRTNKKCAKLRKKIDIPIAIDETGRTHTEIVEAKKFGAADVIVVKVQTCGGIHRAAELVDNWGSDVVVAHMMETQVGVDVGIALAKSIDSSKYAHGLVAPKLESVIREPLDILG